MVEPFFFGHLSGFKKRVLGFVRDKRELEVRVLLSDKVGKRQYVLFYATYNHRRKIMPKMTNTHIQTP
jgi:hypothetical protein